MGMAVPECPEQAGELDGKPGIGFERPGQRGAQVVVVALEALERLDLLRAVQRLVGVDRDLKEVRGVRAAESRLVLARDEAVERVFAMVSSMVRRSPSLRASRLLSRSDASVSRSAAQTRSAAASVQPPMKTARRAKSARSSSSRRP